MAGKGGAEVVVDESNEPAPDASTNGSTARRAAHTRAAKPTDNGAARSPRAKTVSVTQMPVLEQEDPWTPGELAEVRTELEAEQERLHAEVDEAETELADMMRDSGEGAGDDQADAGAATWEREQELSLTNNSKELLEQVEHALERIDEGSYGLCESCDKPIGKMRLQAFPRATLCLPCKQKQERR